MPLHQPLTASELQRLHDMLVLDRDDERTILSIEELHGLVTAAICAPSPASPGDCVAEVFGDREWASGDAVRDAMELFVRFYNQVGGDLQSGAFKPMVNADPTTWCLGFVNGMGLSRESWLAFERDSLRDAMLPILTLAARGTDGQLEEWVSEREQKLAEALPEAALKIYSATRMQ